MESTKYIGMDVHRGTISIAVINSGKLVIESIVETKAMTILQFVQGLRGNLFVTFKEGTWATWLYDLLNPYVTKVVVCNPRRNAVSNDLGPLCCTKPVALYPRNFQRCPGKSHHEPYTGR
jgi:hypothetical protein